MFKKIEIGVIILGLILANGSVSRVLGQEIMRTTRQAEALCEPIAKVISGDIRYQPLTKLCSGDRVSAANGRKVKILCYSRGKIIDIPSDIIDKQCLPLDANERRGCNVLEGGKCGIFKGPDEENKPSKITPYGVVIKNVRPTLSWSKTKGATNYIVRIKGNGGINWQVEVKGESLPYPEDQPALKLGQAYNVGIVAMRGDEVIDGSSALLLLVPTEKLQQVGQTIKILESLQQSPDSLAIDMDAVYEAQNLVHESITVLEARTASGSQDPTIYRLLGDRYLIARFREKANEAYLQAKKLAQKTNNTGELSKLEARLKITAAQN
jgi:hypothetical protein